MYYRVTIEAGLERDSDPFIITRYVEASNTVSLFEKLEQHPGFAEKELGYVITMVQPITKKEYLKEEPDEDLSLEVLRKHVRFQIIKECTIEGFGKNPPFEGELKAETTTCSLKGLGVKYDSFKLKAGYKVKVTIPELKLQKKKAEVIWTSCHDGIYKSGLTWL